METKRGGRKEERGKAIVQGGRTSLWFFLSLAFLSFSLCRPVRFFLVSLILHCFPLIISIIILSFSLSFVFTPVFSYLLLVCVCVCVYRYKCACGLYTLMISLIRFCFCFFSLHALSLLLLLFSTFRLLLTR